MFETDDEEEDDDDDDDDETVALFMCVTDTGLSSMPDCVNVLICVSEDDEEEEEEEDEEVEDDDWEEDDDCACVLLPDDVDVANCDAAIVSRFSAADCVKSCNFLICCKNNNNRTHYLVLVDFCCLF